MAANERTCTVTALMSAALALPGLSGTAGARDVASAVATDYRYSRYSEDALPADRLQAGSARRFTVESHQFDARVPLAPLGGEGADLDLSVQHETMSGASPWFVMPDSENEPVQVMSGATIEETRDDVLATVNVFHAEHRTSVSAGLSEENDYRSVNVGLEQRMDLADGLTTLEAGVGYANNTLDPEGERTVPGQVLEADNDSVSSFVGLSRVLGPHSAMQASLGFGRDAGYLSDPYKLVYVDGDLKPDSRPERRRKGTLTLRYRHFIEPVKASAHVDYRYYQDSWDIHAHTLKVGWHQPLGRGWRLAPMVRYYSQTQADFYTPFITGPSDRREYSNDYRLSPFGALSWTIRVDKSWGALSAGLSYESYQSRASLSLEEVSVENPALVDFDVVAASIKYNFGW